jgi:hypothetical protein
MLMLAMTNGQTRPALDRALQQVANLSLASLVSLQIETFEAAGTMSGDKDLAMCDASAGAFTLTLPSGANVIVGKPYIVKEWHGTNAVTIDAAGAGTIDGGANKLCPAGESVTVVARAIGLTSAKLVSWEVINETAAAGGDASAIHVDQATEIHALTDKPLPLLADELVAETSLAGAWTKVRMAVGNLFKTVGWVDGLTAKTAPTGSDTLPIGDAAAAGAPKKSTLAQIFAAIAGLTAKATPTGADSILISDAAASGAAKSVLLSALLLITNRKTIVFTRVNVVGATASVYRYQNVSGNSETVLKIGSALSAALATGDATITASIDGVAVTLGVVTIAQAGSAAGTKDSATPSGANVIADGASLELTVGGANDAAVFADVAVELSY